MEEKLLKLAHEHIWLGVYKVRSGQCSILKYSVTQALKSSLYWTDSSPKRALLLRNWIIFI